MIYFIRQAETDYIKIGYSDDVSARKIQLQTANPKRLELVATIDLLGKHKDHVIEQAIHRELWQYRLEGEWFHLPKGKLDDIINLYSNGVTVERK